MDYETFKALAGKLCDLDLKNYKSQQMDRRINSLMQAWDIVAYDEFYRVLLTDPQKFREFVSKLTINVSEFFRNPERFYELRQKILPELLGKNPLIKIWSAGCSNGAEPYSVAMILKELKAERRAKIVATDIDLGILKKALAGLYPASEVKNLPADLQTKYFQFENNTYRLNEEIKSLVEFKRHNLLLDPFDFNIDLIICRNVVIYFTEEAKNNLYLKFYHTLKPGGYLLVGGAEPILQYRQLNFIYKFSSFYQKPPLRKVI